MIKLKESLLRLTVLYAVSALVYGLLLYWDIHFDGYFDQISYVQHRFKYSVPGSGQILASGFLSREIMAISIFLGVVGKLLHGFLALNMYLLTSILSLVYTILVLNVCRFTLSTGLLLVPDEVIISVLLFGLLGIFPIKFTFKKR